MSLNSHGIGLFLLIRQRGESGETRRCAHPACARRALVHIKQDSGYTVDLLARCEGWNHMGCPGYSGKADWPHPSWTPRRRRARLPKFARHRIATLRVDQDAHAEVAKLAQQRGVRSRPAPSTITQECQTARRRTDQADPQRHPMAERRLAASASRRAHPRTQSRRRSPPSRPA